MARDPRWGRNEETYGEDPHLTSRLGVAFVKGLTGGSSDLSENCRNNQNILWPITKRTIVSPVLHKYPTKQAI